MTLFPQYAAHLRTKLLKELATEELNVMRQLDAPLLQMVSFLPEKDLIAWLMQREDQFLAAVEDGRAMEWETERLKLWEQDAIPGIPKGGLHPSDVLLFHTAQRSAFVRFAARMAPDPMIRVELLREVEAHFMDVLGGAMRTYQRMRQAAASR